MKTNETLRRIPAVELLVMHVKKQSRANWLDHETTVKTLRSAVAEFRHLAQSGALAPTFETEQVLAWILQRYWEKAELMVEQSLKKVVNATGVVLHTNLGRAPLCARARQQVMTVMEGYSNLEYDLESGGRGERYSHVEQRLIELTGAEAALVVNNNAAAVMLALGGVARGREVIVSRGELVEIGGAFRIPDVIRQSGAVLVEVGATNKTHIRDYEKAISPATAAILKVHTSNFAVVGFTGQPAMAELCQLAHANNLVAINDVGSGTLQPLEVQGTAEPTVQECIAAGFDLVTFSGDKLLGAGQAGLLAGKKRHIEALKKEPLLRALRIDKLSLAALEGTLTEYATGSANETIPGWSMLHASAQQLQDKAERTADCLHQIAACNWRIGVVKTSSLAGGGSLPGVELAGYGIEVEPSGQSAGSVAKQLRSGRIPIVCLVRDDALIFDVRCLLPGDEAILAERLLQIAGNPA